MTQPELQFIHRPKDPSTQVGACIVSQDNKIAVVHNGIIENYVEIKEFLLSKGVCFQSETDTEVVAQLLAFYYRQDGDLMMSVYRVLHRIEGAYALGILCADTPGSFIAARKDAPLLLGYGKGCNFIASDVTAIIKHTREVSFMEDGEVALVTADSITVFDALGRKIDKEHSFVEWDISAAEKGGYAHFMFKEIMEQPDAVRKTVAPRIKEDRIVFDELKLDEAYIRGMKKIFIVACGSSYHVGMVGKYNLERLIRIPVDVMLASEFRYADPLVDEGTLVIVISQSGETLDSMAALRKARDLGARILSIVNVVGSSIARESDHVLYTWDDKSLQHPACASGHARHLVCRYLRQDKQRGILGSSGRTEKASRENGDDTEKYGRHKILCLPLFQP